MVFRINASFVSWIQLHGFNNSDKLSLLSWIARLVYLHCPKSPNNAPNSVPICPGQTANSILYFFLASTIIISSGLIRRSWILYSSPEVRMPRNINAKRSNYFFRDRVCCHWHPGKTDTLETLSCSTPPFSIHSLSPPWVFPSSWQAHWNPLNVRPHN